MTKFTPWFPIKTKPIRQGEYEGREKRTGSRIPVYWRKLHDQPKAGWYFYKGVLGPFNLWESAEDKMSGWRGLAASPTNSGSNHG